MGKLDSRILLRKTRDDITVGERHEAKDGIKFMAALFSNPSSYECELSGCCGG